MKRFKHLIIGTTLHSKMMRAVICLTAGLFTVTFLLFSGVFKHEMQKSIANHQYDLIRTLAQEIDDKIIRAGKHLAGMAGHLPEGIFGDQGFAVEFLDQQRDDKIIFDQGLYLFDSQLDLLATNGLVEGCEFSRALGSSLQAVLKKQSFLVSDPFRLCGPSSTPVVMFAVPVPSPKASQTDGILAGFTSLLNEDFLGSLINVQLGKDGYAYLYNQERTMLIHPDASRILKKDVPPGVNKMYDQALDGFEGSGETVNSRGLHALSSFQRLDSTGWILAANFPVAEAYAPVSRARFLFFSIFVIMVVISALMTKHLMQSLMSPLRQLTARIDRVDSIENFRPLDIGKEDEIQTLSLAFNGLMSRIKDQREQLTNDLVFRETLLDVIPQPVYYKDLSGRYLGCNQAFEDRIGITEEDLVGKTIFAIRPDRAADYHRSDGQVLAGPFGKVHMVEDQVVCSEGRLCDVVFYKSQFLGPDGRIAGLIGSIHDVSALKQSNRQMEEQRKLLRDIIDNLPHAVFWKDTELVYRGCNRLFANNINLESPDDIIGRTDFDLPLEAEQAREFQRRDREVLQTNRPQHAFEEILMRADGRQSTLLTSKVPLHDADGQVKGVLGIYSDITERKQMEQALADKNAELERFLYTVSHDLKSPVVTIKTFSGMFRTNLDEGDTALIRQDLDYIETAAERLTRQLDDLLDMARIGRTQTAPERFSFREVVDRVLSYLAGAIKTQQITVKVSPEDPPFLAEQRQLVDLWQNLIENAIKYMGGQPTPRIEIGLKRETDRILFYVRDNGLGIESDYQNKIFGLFEQLDPQSEGTGLGLARVKRLVEHYGGEIRVESAGRNQGSTFLFTLPEALAQPGEDPTSQEPGAEPSGLDRAC